MINLKTIEFDKYKCFQNDNNRIENLSNLNIFIGKNCSGKTSVMDIIKFLLSKQISPRKYPTIRVEQKIHFNDCIKEKFDEEGLNLSPLLEKLEGKYLKTSILIEKDANIFPTHFVESLETEALNLNNNISKQEFDTLSCALTTEIEDLNVIEISSNRDIIPEDETDYSDLNIESNGEGLTSLLQNFLTNSDLDEEIITETILPALNEIVGKDANFSAIKAKKEQGQWEIYLTENNKSIKLSQMGSGIKTILFVLSAFYLIPKTNYTDKERVYIFEELENNLHPALQRRLYNYIYDYSITNDKLIFITTHSNIAINSFLGKDKTSFYHIVKKNGNSNIHKVSIESDARNILDDLDIKPCDILQTNGIIWVEGPSDRIYIKKWIELMDSILKENLHYNFMFYGGKNLSHFSLTETNELLQIMKINRNACVVIDSDIREINGNINDTKQRIKDEFENNNMFCWITKGKEIENYIDVKVINKVFNCSLSQIGQYELFPEYINDIFTHFTNNKVKFAKLIIPEIKEQNLDILDLKAQIQKLVTTIYKWNE